MSNAIVPFNAAKLAMALKKTSREAAPSGAFLKMDKTGAWIFGVEEEEVNDTEQFMVNPEGFQHGYVAWGDSEKLGEVIAPVTEQLADTGPVPGGAKGWEFQLGAHFKQTDGDLDLVYRSSSVGGKRAIAGLASEVSEKLLAGDPKCVAVVTLSSDSYKHKQYGKIYTPVITVFKWIAMPSEAAPKTAPAKPAAKKAKKAKGE